MGRRENSAKEKNTEQNYLGFERNIKELVIEELSKKLKSFSTEGPGYDLILTNKEENQI